MPFGRSLKKLFYNPGIIKDKFLDIPDMPDDSEMSPIKDPSQSAMPFLDEAAQYPQQYMSPYIGMGQQAGDILQGQFGEMAQDPASMLSRLMQGYAPTPYYQMMQDRLSQAAANTAAAGGMRGSPLEQTRQQEITQGLLSKDMQQYLQNVLGLQSQGLAGQQGLFGAGFDASRGLSSDLSNIAGTKGGLAFQGAREQQQQEQDRLAQQLGMGAMKNALGQSQMRGWESALGGLSEAGGGKDNLLKSLLKLGGTVGGGLLGGPAGAGLGGALGGTIGGFF